MIGMDLMQTITKLRLTINAKLCNTAIVFNDII